MRFKGAEAAGAWLRCCLDAEGDRIFSDALET